MKFEEMYTPINKMQPAEAVAFFLDFCARREKSFIVPVKARKPKKAAKGKTKSNGKMVSVTPEELAKLRRMGLIA